MVQLGMLNPEDRELLGSLAENHYRQLLWVAWKLLCSESEAEDAVQNAFLAVAGRVSTLKCLTMPQRYGYLASTVRNFAYMTLREEQHFVYEKRLEEMDESLEDKYAELPERICIRREEADAVRRAIAKLDRIYYDVINLYYLNECSLSEICLLLGRKRNTVETRLKRGRKYLQEILEQDSYRYR